jgi:hypothetical protein
MFIIENEVIKTITGLGNQDSCHEMFKDVHILALTLQYTYTHNLSLSLSLSVLCKVILNRAEFVLVTQIHRIFTRQGNQLLSAHIQTNIISNMGIKTHNKLPPFIKNASDNSKTFKTLVKKLLYFSLLYSLEQHFNYSSTKILLTFTCTVAVTEQNQVIFTHF